MGSMRKNINFIIPRNFRESFNKKDRFVRLSTNLIFNYYLSLYFRFGLKGRFLRWTRKRFSCWIYFLEPLWGPFFDNNFYFWLYVMYRNKSVNGVLNFFVRSNKIQFHLSGSIFKSWKIDRIKIRRFSEKTDFGSIFFSSWNWILLIGFYKGNFNKFCFD